MEPSTTFDSSKTIPVMAPAPTSSRSALRYRFAQLMTEEHFEQALNEAEQAYREGRVQEMDLRFVMNVVNSARKMGRFRPAGSGSIAA